MKQIAVLGHGVVGSGVVELLHKNRDIISKNAGEPLEVKRILDLRDFDVPYADLFTKDYMDILSDPEISIVVEVMGGINPAYDFVKAAMHHKKSVVTSNKELVAVKGAELLEIARQNDVNFLFEASVGGGIPIIRPMHRCLAANRLEEVAGILNGTTNFILTKMIQDKMEAEDALEMAQRLGYAEKDPSADINGHDACRKICILASLAYGHHIYPDYVHTEGIDGIALEDVKYAASGDYVIKLIGRAKQLEDDSIYCMVSPMLLRRSCQLAGVDDVFNGILVRGDAVGDTVFYGRGAGKFPTASAVVGDIINAAKAKGTSNTLTWQDDAKNHVKDYLDTSIGYYIRISACDVENVEERIASCFGKVTYLSRDEQPETERAFLVPELNERQLIEIEKELSEKDNIEIISKVRVLNY